MGENTPLPLQIHPIQNQLIMGPGGEWFAETKKPEHAALIVKAVNMHERLVAALSWALDNADYRDSNASKRAFAILAETEKKDDG